MTNSEPDSLDARQQVIQAALREAFWQHFGEAPDVRCAMAPGRVNLLGDYTDLNDGFVLPMTLDRGVYVAARRRSDSAVRIHSLRYDATVQFTPGSPPVTEAGAWSSYVVGVVEELRQRDLLGAGFDAVIDGDLDLGAGLSSSAALTVAMATALQLVDGFSLQPVEMAKLCQHVEHRYANVLCGIMDQFASRIGRAGHALFLDCRSLDYRHIPMRLGDYRIVIVASGVERSLAASAYNTRRAECQAAVDYFQRIDDRVLALRDVTAAMLDAHGAGLAATPLRRCRHVVSENQRVLLASDRLGAGELREFGQLMSASHASLRDDFEVSCAELDALVELAGETDGVLGSRMTGGGFGGCTVSLVHEEAVAALAARVNRDYVERFGLRPSVYVLRQNLESGALC